MWLVLLGVSGAAKRGGSRTRPARGMGPVVVKKLINQDRINPTPSPQVPKPITIHPSSPPLTTSKTTTGSRYSHHMFTALAITHHNWPLILIYCNPWLTTMIILWSSVSVTHCNPLGTVIFHGGSQWQPLPMGRPSPGPRQLEGHGTWRRVPRPTWPALRSLEWEAQRLLLVDHR